MGDAAASRVRDGALIAAAGGEGFSRVRHRIGFPHEAVRCVLAEAGIGMEDVGHVGLYRKPWVLSGRVPVTLGSPTNPRAAFQTRVRRGAQQVGGHYRRMVRLPRFPREQFGPSGFTIPYLDHHPTHAAQCSFVSPHDRVAIFTVDGTGESTTKRFARGQGTTTGPLERLKLPHSLGQVDPAVTNPLGFDMKNGDVWKVMGLSGWGEPVDHDDFVRNILIPIGRNDFRVNSRLPDRHTAKNYRFHPEFMKVAGPNREP